MFERMEIAEQFYEGGTPSKTTTRADPNRASHGKKHKGGEDSSEINLKKGCAGNRKKNHAGHTIDRPTGEKHNWCVAPDTLWRSVKYSRNTPISMHHSGPTKKPNKETKKAW